MTAADQEIRDLTERLGLIDQRQDWGIANADGRRVGEFIQVCRAGGLSAPQQYAMAELVVASMNEALVDGLVDEKLADAFADFLALELLGLPAQVRYWASLPDGAEFPIAGLMAKAATTA